MNKKILLVFWLIFIALYSINILKFPIFEDEGQYLLYAQAIFDNPLQYFIVYFQNGILPMFGWLAATLTIFTQDSLLAARLLNVLLVSTLVFWIDRVAFLYSFNNKFRYIAIIFLFTSPVLFLNARIGLLDTSILVFTSWYIYFTAKILKKSDKKYDSLGLLISLLGAFLTKATAVFGLPTILFLLILTYMQNGKKINLGIKKVLIIYSAVLSLLIAPLIFYGRQVAWDSGVSSVSFLDSSQIISKIKLNLRLTWMWFIVYFGQFLLLLPLLTFLKKKRINQFYLIMVIWALTSILLMIIMNRFYYPRHILNLTVPFIVVAAGILSEIPVFAGSVILSIMILIKLSTNYYLLFDFQKANLALEDRVSYFEEYTAGTRVNDVASKIDSLSQQDPITVWLDGTYTLEYGLRRNLTGKKNIKFLSYRLGKQFIVHNIEEIYKDNARVTYVVVNRFQPLTKNNLELIENFKISFRQDIQIYQVK